MAALVSLCRKKVAVNIKGDISPRDQKRGDKCFNRLVVGVVFLLSQLCPVRGPVGAEGTGVEASKADRAEGAPGPGAGSVFLPLSGSSSGHSGEYSTPAEAGTGVSAGKVPAGHLSVGTDPTSGAVCVQPEGCVVGAGRSGCSRLRKI